MAQSVESSETPEELRVMIETALQEMSAWLAASSWVGRENEAVNLFAHRFLAPRLDPTRIGIEVAVNQVAQHDGSKALVRKDLVIWHQPDETFWTGAGVPAAVIEWKRDDNPNKADVAWLRQYVARFPEVLCYVANARIHKEPREVLWQRIAGE